MTLIKTKSQQEHNNVEKASILVMKYLIAPLFGLFIMAMTYCVYVQKQEDHAMQVAHMETFKAKRKDILRELNGYLLKGQYETVKSSIDKLTLVEDEELDRIRVQVNKELKAKKAHKDKIKQQFNPFNGAHYNLEAHILKYADDPTSYQHIETQYSDNKDHVVVLTKFRIKNGFGALKVFVLKAKVNENGDILKVWRP